MGVSKVLRIASVVALTLIATFNYFTDHSPKPNTWSIASAASGPIRSAPLRDLRPAPRTRFVQRPMRGFRPSPPGRGTPLASVLAPYRPFADGLGLLRRAGTALSQLIFPSLAAIPAPLGNFEGLGNGFSGPSGTFTFAGTPPDTNGDIGPNHYVQVVNTSLAIFNKSGTALYGPVNINTLWSGFGGGCQTNNDGDPIVLYDPIADRWVISQFSVNTTPYLECVAVSQTGDPTGAYYRYAFDYGSLDFPDYPKMGVWPDAYYTTFNIFAGGQAFSGPRICAYDRGKMLAGQPATQQCFDVKNQNLGGALPADLDGARQPPAGAPNYIVALGETNTTLAFWKFHVDWTTPTNSTLTGPTNLTVPAFAGVCADASGDCIPQPNGSKLESLDDRLLYRLAYRNFGDHESLVVNHTIAAGSSAGVRWYELRVAAGALSIFQQGTYAPDSNYRWMGSLAMDQSGNIGLGFSLSSTSVAPGIHYTGRLAGDPAGTMAQGEGVIIAGGGSQTDNSGAGHNRWGDYSMMAVDPTDDCTFWYSNEYLKANGGFDTWSTQIGTFKFPGCGSSTVGTIALSPATGTSQTGLTHSVTAHAQSGATSPVPVAGATVNFTVLTGPNAGKTGSATTNSSGDASFTYQDRGPGTDTIQAKIGTETSNTVSMTWTITTLTPVITASNSVYDGTTAASLLTCTLSGAVASPPGDPVTCSGIATFSDKNVANGKTVTATDITLAGVGAPNYVLSTTTATTTANITPKPATLTAGDGTKVHGTPDPAITASPTGFLPADGITVSATRAAGESVGSYVTSATASGAALANYSVSYLSGTFTITKATMTVVANNKTRSHNAPNPIFDGTITGVVAGDGITVTYSTPATTVPGTYPITPALMDPNGKLGNYSVTLTAGTLTLTNSAPVAVNDAYTTQWNTVLTPANSVLQNDTDLDADPLTAIKLTNPTHGTVTLNVNGSFTYIPAANYSGADAFTYRANDGYLDSQAATVTLTITSPCHADDDRDSHDRKRNGHHDGAGCEHVFARHGGDDRGGER